MPWDESWLRDYQSRMAQTKPTPAASVATANMIAFTLAKPTLLLNQIRKMERPIKKNGRTYFGLQYMDYRDALSAEIAALVPADPHRKPWRHVSVTVRRFSVGFVPDHDGLHAGLKPLLDVLQPRSDRHPSGLGLIWNDSPEFLTLTVNGVHVTKKSEARTLVTIERLSQTEPVCVL